MAGEIMFISVGKSKERYCSLTDEEEFLREQSKLNEMFCPECLEPVKFRAGTRTPHFYHFRSCLNPNPYTEPESETHLNGKFAIYSWLKSLYPNSEVSLECYIPETKQRSDVMLIHSSGERWAFEFQCAKITGLVWKERHELYKQADIKDFWILNSELIQQISELHYRVIGLESAIYQSELRLIYLDVSQQIISLHIDGDLYDGNLTNPKILKDLLENAYIFNGQIRLSAYDVYLKELEEKNEAIRQAQLRYMKENEEKERAKERREQIEQEKKTRNLRGYYNLIIEERQILTAKMTPKEKEMFLHLMKKHALIAENFPAVCMLEVEYSDLILTPKQLWQLWVYDYIVSKWDGFIRKGRKTNIWFDYMKENFKIQKSKGVFRTRHTTTEKANFMFAIYNYLDRLNEVGVLQNLSSWTTRYQQLLINRIPMFYTHKENALLKLFIEGYSHEIIDEVGKKYIEQIKIIQRECHKAKQKY